MSQIWIIKQRTSKLILCVSKLNLKNNDVIKMKGISKPTPEIELNECIQNSKNNAT